MTPLPRHSSTPPQSSESLRGQLSDIDPNSPLFKTAMNFLQLKGWWSVASEALGLIQVTDDIAYFYFVDPAVGLLELEVERLDDRFRRRVTGFVTEVEQLRDLLAS